MSTHRTGHAARVTPTAVAAAALASCGGVGCGDLGGGPCGKPPAIRFGLGTRVPDCNGDGRHAIVVDGSVSTTATGAGVSGPPGVLLHDPARSGSYLPLQNVR